jgi:hypothetical protein
MAQQEDDGLDLREGEVQLLPLGRSLRALVRCGGRTARLVAFGQIRQPRTEVGRWFSFADGTAAQVYRETTIERGPPTRPVVLVVGFRLRDVHRPWSHALFRWESELNTVLFAGFPGLVSKLWFRHDERGLYRGLYEWDEPELAESYVRALWWALAVVSERESIRYRVLLGLRRAQLIEQAGKRPSDGTQAPAWWRVTGVGTIPADDR